MNLSENKISELSSIKSLNLIELNLNGNRIDKTEGFDGHTKLQILSLRRNKIMSVSNIKDLPSLTELYLVLSKQKQITFIGRK